MWAFAVYDKRNQVLTLCRDRFGEKPLYYAHDAHDFYFASSIKTIEILRGEKFDINKAKISRFLVNGYKSIHKKDDLFFEQVFQVKSSSTVSVKTAARLDFKTYWRPKENKYLFSSDKKL